MKTYGCLRPAAVLVSLVIVLSPLATFSQDKPDKKQSGKSAGFVLSADASAEDVGLPIYPGAKPLKEDPKESSAVKMGLWGGSSGFKLAVLKLESNDSAAKIADFYRKELTKYGTVLDCGQPSAAQTKSSSDTNQLECDDDQPVKGGYTLKAGTKNNQHIVGIEPKGSHTKIALVYVQTPPEDKTN